MASFNWKLRNAPRRWQSAALECWRSQNKGVVSIVTGGGKTVFAFLCMDVFAREHVDPRFVILVPTLTLLDQWYVSLQDDFGVSAAQIACFSSEEKPDKPAPINIVVINTARTLAKHLGTNQCFLIVDECHRAGSPANAKALTGEFAATLGLSATPEREYDEGFERHVVPVLGPVIFKYDYVQALQDKVVTPFNLINVRVDFLPNEEAEYKRLTRRAAVLYRTSKVDPSVEPKLKRTLQKRASISAQARMRIPVAIRILEEHRGVRTIIFHERIAAAAILYKILKERNHSATIYHSQIGPEWRRDNLRLFRQGVFDVLISCRALDEGMNVPETAIAIIASSTASHRQRIQRLGRVLRPSQGKEKAVIYTLFATDQEKSRLMIEEAHLEGVASVQWATGKRQERHG